ncbi:MAG: XRE family transcriptional regulator [Bacteroidota bacterium]
MTDPVLDRLDHVNQLIDDVDPVTLGSRIRRVRTSQQLSIRELADRAGVNKNSVVRLEQGRGTTAPTVLRICTGLGVHVERLVEADDGVVIARAHRSGDDRWYDMTHFGAGPLLGADRPLSEGERQQAVADGADVPLNLLQSRLPDGRVLPTVLELYGPSETRSHPGEEFVYVLRGRVRVDVGPESYDLGEGESLTFHSAEPHAYAPAGEGPVPRLLSVRVEG